MRKLISHVHISLDGFAAGPNGEIFWVLVDDEIFERTATLTERADAAIYGRKTFQIMEGYWPTAADRPDATKHDREHGAWYGKTQKYVLSNTFKSTDLKTAVLGGDIASQITALKSSEGKDIVLFGSISSAQMLLEQNLIDELCLYVNPILLGNGIPFFKQSSIQKRLHLIESHTFSSGVIELDYQVLG